MGFEPTTLSLAKGWYPVSGGLSVSTGDNKPRPPRIWTSHSVSPRWCQNWCQNWVSKMMDWDRITWHRRREGLGEGSSTSLNSRSSASCMRKGLHNVQYIRFPARRVAKKRSDRTAYIVFLLFSRFSQRKTVGKSACSQKSKWTFIKMVGRGEKRR